jgi:hypothetical protein
MIDIEASNSNFIVQLTNNIIDCNFNYDSDMS